MAGRQITLDELTVGLGGAALWVRKLARAAETPDTPVELSDTIKELRRIASQLAEQSDRMAFLARVVEGDVPLAKTFDSGDPWGTAARGTDRKDFGGPALIPTQWQLGRLAQEAKWALARDATADTTTYPEAMKGVGMGWESKEAQARRRRERDAAVAREVLITTCETCDASEGQQCRTKNGRVSEKSHVGRQREAEATVDARLGYLGDNPVAVPEA
ncbi:zinc finger domain-containing protein [Streptomyces sp. SP18BB07]|uniref:zinc finger domain-containing protein n=1 Tax=Streptomyces sp. SP18BB07 TaxID=3002522 RepID=UPI002E7666FF|nr:hypothetical protein [Streptomyces sp. SP18BB07]MEE1764365.1 hypothetical protein [Streptomyces sp. SP18BB07]